MDVARAVFDAVPTGHAWQSLEADNPDTDDQRPNAQLTHTLMDVAPEIEDQVPAAQFRHELAAAIEDQVPAKHFTHALKEVAAAIEL